MRKKLAIAEEFAENNDFYNINVNALIESQPEELTAGDIDTRIGVTWIDIEYYIEFMHQNFNTPRTLENEIVINYSNATNKWNISNKHRDRGNMTATATLGTDRVNAYELLELSLNQKIAVVKDEKIDVHGNKTYVTNAKETTLAQL